MVFLVRVTLGLLLMSKLNSPITNIQFPHRNTAVEPPNQDQVRQDPTRRIRMGQRQPERPKWAKAGFGLPFSLPYIHPDHLN